MTKKLTIEDMQRLAEKKGGNCLSTEYHGGHKKLKWQCAKGHIWESTPSSVKYGTWCPYCYGNVKLTIEEMQELAKSKGGKCLSTNYVNSSTHLRWQCKEGHIWEAIPNNIKRGKWCPTCARKRKKS